MTEFELVSTEGEAKKVPISSLQPGDMFFTTNDTRLFVVGSRFSNLFGEGYIELYELNGKKWQQRDTAVLVVVYPVFNLRVKRI